MKKILISILTILGIGLSFCVSNDYTIVLSGNSYDYLSLYDNTIYSSDFTLNRNRYLAGVGNISLSGFNSPVILTEICLFDSQGYQYLYNTNLSVSNIYDGYIYCFDVSSLNIDLSVQSFPYALSYGSKDSGLNDFTYGVGSIGNPFFNTSDGFILLSPISDVPGLNFLFNVPVEDDYSLIPYSFSFTIEQTLPKFKVNYGNTSYEYELEDNLFIHLKSPTVQSGNTFIYAGSTGINLFYNGTSQFYSKSNLYLESMYWFNNNIFTPICL